MQKRIADFGGKGMVVERRLDPSMSLPQLPVLRQRGILSEVIKKHGEEEVAACKLAPSSSPSRAQARCSSIPLRSRSAASLKPVDVERIPKTKCAVSAKVVEVYDHDPGGRPRKLTVERRMRQYAAQDIGALLLDLGVPTRAHWDVGQAFPLIYFDDTDYDVHTALEWIALGEGLPIEARGFRIDGEGQWEDCNITSYVCESNQPGSTGRFVGNFQGDKAPCSLTRLEVCFFGEDPEVFTERVSKAIKSRRDANDAVKFNFYVDNMPIDDVPGIDSDSIGRVIELGRRSESLSKEGHILEGAISEIIKEINLDFSRTMNKLAMKRKLAQHAAGERAMGEDVHKGELSLDALTLPDGEREKVKYVRENSKRVYIFA